MHCRLEPRDITADALCKLSPLVDDPANAILVNRDGKIVGVGQRNRGEVGVVAHHAGRLTVTDATTILGVFERGRWEIVGDNFLQFSLLIQKALPKKPGDRLEKATLITHLTRQARRARRGAILVFLPNDRREGIGSIAYPVASFPALPSALSAWRSATASTPAPAEKQRNDELVRCATSIAAAGAGIDGATLIDAADLHLLGFGVKIIAPDARFEVEVVEWPTRTTCRVDKSKIGGMRHQSAARLVHCNHDASVITVSQDGMVSLLVWDSTQAIVRMEKHLDRYLY
jgi:hypothetical protein